MHVLAHALRSVSKRKRETWNKLRLSQTTVSVSPERCKLFPNMYHLRKRWGCTESVHKTSSSLCANRRAAVYVTPVPIGLRRAENLRRRISLAMLSRLIYALVHWLYGPQQGYSTTTGFALEPVYIIASDYLFSVWVIQLFVSNEPLLTSFNNKTHK